VHAQGVRALGAGFYLLRALRAQGSYLGAGLLLAALYLCACLPCTMRALCLSECLCLCVLCVCALCLSVLCVPVRGAGHRNNFAGTHTFLDHRLIKRYRARITGNIPLGHN
jgi:hypothetical protein